MSLAETLYHAWRADKDPAVAPPWGNLPTDERAAWLTVEFTARNKIAEQIGKAVCDEIYGTAEAVGAAWAAQRIRGAV